MSQNPSLHTQGTKLYRGIPGSPVTYAAGFSITDIQPAEIKRKALDATTLDQDDDYMQKVGSVLKEVGAVEVELLYDPENAQQLALRDDLDETEPRPFRVEYRNGDREDFLGIVTSWKPAGKMDELYKVKVTIEVSGGVTFTPAA